MEAIDEARSTDCGSPANGVVNRYANRPG